MVCFSLSLIFIFNFLSCQQPIWLLLNTVRFPRVGQIFPFRKCFRLMHCCILCTELFSGGLLWVGGWWLGVRVVRRLGGR
jgi:hypothetical protein